MSKYLPALLAACVALLVVLLLRDPVDLGVRCLEPQDVAQQIFEINRPGYCVAVAPVSLDRDDE